MTPEDINRYGILTVLIVTTITMLQAHGPRIVEAFGHLFRRKVDQKEREVDREYEMDMEREDERKQAYVTIQMQHDKFIGILMDIINKKFSGMETSLTGFARALEQLEKELHEFRKLVEEVISRERSGGSRGG